MTDSRSVRDRFPKADSVRSQLNTFYRTVDVGQAYPSTYSALRWPATFPIAHTDWPAGLNAHAIPPIERPVLDTIVAISPFNEADIPIVEATEWTYQAQGVTHDDNFWYFSGEQQGVTRIGRWEDLEDPIEVSRVRPKLHGVDHFGGLSYCPRRRIVAVAMEGDGKPKLGIFGTGERWGQARMCPFPAEQGNLAPWCAINPLNGLLYTADFYSYKPNLVVGKDDSGNELVARYKQPDPLALNVYELTVGPDLTPSLRYLREMPLYVGRGRREHLFNLQGAGFSPNGHLYITAEGQWQFPIDKYDDFARVSYEPADDALWHASRGGVFAFEMLQGNRIGFTSVPFEPSWKGGGQEVQGVTIWNIDDGPAVGQMHVMVTDTGYRVWLKHYRFSAEDAPLL